MRFCFRIFENYFDAGDDVIVRRLLELFFYLFLDELRRECGLFKTEMDLLVEDSFDFLNCIRPFIA